MKFHLPELDRRVELGLLTKRKHLEWPLWIYNYTTECAFNSSNWDYYTLQSRGLILDEQGNVVSLPFKKFFNINEIEETLLANLPNEQPEVVDKLDGSLIITYIGLDNKIHCSTRGVFNSPQAKLAEKILYRKYKKQLSDLCTEMKNRQITLLFELLAPENAIVVDYSGKKDLVLIGQRDSNGADLSYRQVANVAKWYGFPYPAFVDLSVEEILNKAIETKNNIEGWVLRYSNGLRVKVKTEHYAALFRVLVGLSDKSIWKMLIGGNEIRIPLSARDDIKNTVKKEIERFTKAYKELEKIVREIYKETVSMKFISRKDFALFFKNKTNDPLLLAALFCILDGKEYKFPLWKKLEPGKAKMLGKISPEGL